MLQVEAAFDELSEDVKQQHAAQQQQKLTSHMAKVLEAVDLDMYMKGVSSCSFLPTGTGALAGPTVRTTYTPHSPSAQHHAGASLEEAVRPGHKLPEKVLQAGKEDDEK